MKTINKIILTLITIGLYSCGHSMQQYDEALNLSGDNRIELEKVVSHYETSNEPKKQKAAIFLIENLVDKTSITIEDTTAYHKLLYHLRDMNDPRGWDPVSSTVQQTLDSVLNIYKPSVSETKDIEHLHSRFLIDNIDNAFEVWGKTPWNQDYTFDEFCEYVLPYKVGRERPESWRSTILNTTPLSPIRDPWQRAVELINSTGLYYNIGMSGFPYPMTFTDIDIVHKGSCSQMATLALYYFRTHGIPSGIDLIPGWANRSSSHMWNVVIMPNGKSKSISYRPDGTNELSYKISKIYRRTYITQPQYRMSESEIIPAFFRNNDVIDVTDQYDMPTSDVKISLNNDIPADNIYLATFDNSSWTPVAMANKLGGEVTFRSVGRGVLPSDCDHMTPFINSGCGIVYLPVYSLKYGIVGASHPFILDTLGNIKFLAPKTASENVKLTRKYPKDPQFGAYENAMVGGQFEGANKPDFSNAEVLCQIIYPPCDSMGIMNTYTRETFRYIRYTPNSGITHGCYAEFVFYDAAGKAIKGSALNGDKAFDSNALTYAEGLPQYEYDLGSRYNVTKIGYLARTDDNGISPRDEYELFYWDGKWLSLGKKIAKTHFLEYDVPKNALFWLRNLTKGTEERIFTIQDGKQVWW